MQRLLLTLVTRVWALPAPAAAVPITGAIRTLGELIHSTSTLVRGFCKCRGASRIVIVSKRSAIGAVRGMILELFGQDPLDMVAAT